MKHWHLFLAIVCIAPATALRSEDAITEFKEKFAINVFGNYNIGIFKQPQTQGFRTDQPWKVGLGVRYKKYAASFFVPLDLKFNSFDMELNSYFEQLYFETFWKRYQSYFDDKLTAKPNVGLDITSIGVRAGWAYNHRNHSLSAVFTLDKRQNVSSGSFLYGFGVYYTSLYSQNAEFERYSERAHIIYFGPMAGYSYTWVLPRGMFVNACLSVGVNLGINASTHAAMFIPQVHPKISTGRHGGTWSVNLVMGSNAMFLLYDDNYYNTLAPSSVLITFSKRF